MERKGNHMRGEDGKGDEGGVDKSRGDEDAVVNQCVCCVPSGSWKPASSQVLHSRA